jgi:hypothetical protein
VAAVQGAVRAAAVRAAVATTAKVMRPMITVAQTAAGRTAVEVLGARDRAALGRAAAVLAARRARTAATIGMATNTRRVMTDRASAQPKRREVR